MFEFEQIKNETGSGKRNNLTRKEISVAIFQDIEREKTKAQKVQQTVEIMGNKKYINDGILARLLGVNNLDMNKLTKNDINSYYFGYYDMSNVLIHILCQGIIPERLTKIIEIKHIELDKELYPEELLKEIGTRDSSDENININTLSNDISANESYLSGYNNKKTK